MRNASAVLIACAVLVLPACRKTQEQRIADSIERLRSPDQAVSGPAGRELVDIGEPAVPALGALLQDPEPRVRRAAASTLWGLGTRASAAVPGLAQTLRDVDPEVRLSAAMALESAGPAARPAVPALVDAAKVDFLRGSAEESLRKIQGPQPAAP